MRIAGAAVPDADNSFAFFDRIYCVYFRTDAPPLALAERLRQFAITARVRAIHVDPRVVDLQVSIALAHRQVLEEALVAQAQRVLVLEDQALLASDAMLQMLKIAHEVGRLDARGEEWSLLYLGAATWGAGENPLLDCEHLLAAAGCTGTHALAYHRPVFARILGEIPADIPHLADWSAKYGTFDRYLAGLPGRILARRRIVSVNRLLLYEDPAMRDRFVD